MSTIDLFQDIKKENKELYDEVLKKHLNFDKHPKTKEIYLKKIRDLISKITLLAKEVSTVDDYNWLDTAASQWQVIFSSVLNIPENIQLPAFRKGLKFSSHGNVAKEGNFTDILNNRSYFFFRDRVLSYAKENQERLIRGFHSTEDEISQDRKSAINSITSDILTGKINFLRDINSNIYNESLEDIWLKDVKLFNAYLNWTKRRDGIKTDETDETADYYKHGCEKIRDQLINQDLKEPNENFLEIENYISRRFLNEKNILDINKPQTREMIKRKAHRIWEITQNSNSEENWYLAETYAKMFYNNIIPAVLKKDELSISKILKSFQFSKGMINGNRLLVINCFEAALAIYFLDLQIIKRLWRQPQTSNFSFVPVTNWPVNINSKACRIENFNYDDKGKIITYEGVMSERGKKILISMVGRSSHIHAVENLFSQSSLDPKLMSF